MGKESEQTISQRRHASSHQVQGKVVNITHHQRNARQNTVRHPLTPVRMAVIRKAGDSKY